MSEIPTNGSCRFEHIALLYRDEREYLAGALPFVRAGLDRSEPVAVSVPAGNLAAIERALGPDRRHVLLLDMSTVGRNPGTIIAGVLRAFADRHPGRHVRIVGELVWPRRSVEEYPACAQHEALINRSFAGLDVAILCPYDRTRLSAVALSDACRTHPEILDAAGPRPSSSYDPDDVVAYYNRALPPLPHAMSVTADVAALAAARGAVRTAALASGLPAARCDDAVLAVNELVSNSVEHGGGVAELFIDRRGPGLVCQIDDAGYIVDPLAGRHPSLPGQPRGRGLLLVNQLADLVRTYTARSGTSIRVWFRTQAAQP